MEINRGTRLIAADAVIAGMPDAPPIEHAAGLGCFYRPISDIVSMEPLPGFGGPEFYYGVLFHELIHATGHPRRLNRRDKNGALRPFVTKAYGVEELTAELGAAYLCQQVGIANERLTENQAGYLQNWLEALRYDKRLFSTRRVPLSGPPSTSWAETRPNQQTQQPYSKQPDPNRRVSPA